MTSQYDELDKLFTGTWLTDRDENMAAFGNAAGFPEEMKKMLATEKSYAFVRDGESFRETTSFSSGAEMKSHLKLDKVNVWKDKEENPNMHVEVMSPIRDPNMHVEITPTFKDGALTQDINPMMENVGKRHTIKLYRQGDEAVMECSVPGGPTGKRFYKKL